MQVDRTKNALGEGEIESISTDTESVGVESAISELRNAIMENKFQYKIAYSAFCVWKCS